MITKQYKFNAPIGDVWKALVNAKTIDEWGGGPAAMNDKVGTEFSLWGGDVYGKNLEVIPEKKLVQDWYGGKWDKPSKATFELSTRCGKTTLNFSQTDVPEDEVTDIDAGWDDYYFGPMQDLLEK